MTGEDPRSPTTATVPSTSRTASTSDCLRCHGEGELKFNRSRNQDPQMEDFAPCTDCGGTGEVLTA